MRAGVWQKWRPEDSGDYVMGIGRIESFRNRLHCWKLTYTRVVVVFWVIIEGIGARIRQIS